MWAKLTSYTTNQKNVHTLAPCRRTQLQLSSLTDYLSQQLMVQLREHELVLRTVIDEKRQLLLSKY